MKKLQTELSDLEAKVQMIHLTLPKDHQFWRLCQLAEMRRRGKEEMEKNQFVMRGFLKSGGEKDYEDGFKDDSQSWDTDSNSSQSIEEIQNSKEKDRVEGEGNGDSKGKPMSLGSNREPIGFLLKKQLHMLYGLKNLMDQKNVKYFEVQKPWTVYWSLNALAAINELSLVKGTDRQNLVKYVLTFENLDKGGFSGGTHYHSNIISLYGAALSLALLERPEQCLTINRAGCQRFFKSMKVYLPPDGPIRRRLRPDLQNGKMMCSFKLSQNGEVDIRNIYTALVSHELFQLGEKESIFEGCVEYILACQSYEGGLGPHPGREAHGGYTYCGVAALSLLDSLHLLDINRLLRWLTNRQMYYEGGFSGRTNKIVDSCYTFWQGACFNIISDYFKAKPEFRGFLYEPFNLHKYLLLFCQGKRGGMKDKPSKYEDPYHTMYALIGLGLSVNLVRKVSDSFGLGEDWPETVFAEIDPIFTIPKKSVKIFKSFWKAENLKKSN